MSEPAAVLPDPSHRVGSGWAIWKILSGIILTAALFPVLAYGIAYAGWMPPPSSQAWFILLVTAGGLIVKILVSDIITGEFHYYKHGYDLSVMTLGAVISGFSVQVASPHDLYPGVASLVTVSSLEPYQRNCAVLFCLFLLACLASLITARIGKDIRSAVASPLLSLTNFSIGALSLGTYVFVLVVKG